MLELWFSPFSMLLSRPERACLNTGCWGDCQNSTLALKISGSRSTDSILNLISQTLIQLSSFWLLGEVSYCRGLQRTMVPCPWMVVSQDLFSAPGGCLHDLPCGPFHL